MDNRTIRRAISRRVHEIYFIHSPVRRGGKIYWRMLANIKIKGGKEKIFKLLADMPDTALISHKELLTTMVSEVYDYVQKIKNRAISPPMLAAEKDWTPMSKEDERALGINTIEEMIGDSPKQIMDLDALQQPIALPKPEEKPKLIIPA